MYIEQAYRGLTEGWRYVLGLIFVFLCWQVLGALPLMIAILMKTDSLTAMENLDLTGMITLLGQNSFLFLTLIAFALGLISLFAYVIIVHRQKILYLTTSRRHVDWGRTLFTFMIWGTLSAALILIDVYMSPDDYVLNFKWGPFLVLLAISITMIPIQTSMEEYYMRAYMIQGLGISFKKRWVPLVITSILFGTMHIFNPEIDKIGYGLLVFYIGTGFFLGIITLMDGGIEIPLGFHAANNLVASLLVSTDWTAFQTDSIFKDISEPSLGWDAFLPVFVLYPLFLWLLSKKYEWKDWKSRLTGNVLEREAFLETLNYPDQTHYGHRNPF